MVLNSNEMLYEKKYEELDSTVVMKSVSGSLDSVKPNFGFINPLLQE